MKRAGIGDPCPLCYRTMSIRVRNNLTERERRQVERLEKQLDALPAFDAGRKALKAKYQEIVRPHFPTRVEWHASLVCLACALKVGDKHRCSCGKVSTWEDMPLIGYQPDGPGRRLEQRNCPVCDSTRSREVDVSKVEGAA